MQLTCQVRRFHVFFSGKHFICIASDSIDLTVVNNETVGMCSFPAWIGVGAETGMNHGNGRFIVRALQIRKECAELSHKEHTFVNNGTTAHGYHISIIITLFKFTAHNI